MAVHFVVVDFDGGFTLHLVGPRITKRQLAELAGSTGKVVALFRYPALGIETPETLEIEECIRERPNFRDELLGLLAETLALGSRLPPISTREDDIYQEKTFRVFLKNEEKK